MSGSTILLLRRFGSAAHGLTLPGDSQRSSDRDGFERRIIEHQRAARSRTTHDAAVQMIDTSIVRVHQHGACVTRNRRHSMGRSRGGLTSKIHAVVDTNGLPRRLALTAGEAHDNRLAGRPLSRLKSGTMLLADLGYDADWIRSTRFQTGAWANIPPRGNRKGPICFRPHLPRAQPGRTDLQ